MSVLSVPCISTKSPSCKFQSYFLVLGRLLQDLLWKYSWYWHMSHILELLEEYQSAVDRMASCYCSGFEGVAHWQWLLAEPNKTHNTFFLSTSLWKEYIFGPWFLLAFKMLTSDLTTVKKSVTVEWVSFLLVGMTPESQIHNNSLEVNWGVEV